MLMSKGLIKLVNYQKCTYNTAFQIVADITKGYCVSRYTYTYSTRSGQKQ